MELEGVGYVSLKPMTEGLSKPLREPRRDLLAQIRALLDPQHPKLCVFIPEGKSEVTRLDFPKDAFVVHRKEGIFITLSSFIAEALWDRETITEDDMAKLLDYPQSKDKIDPDLAVVVQAKDAQGCVITECLVNKDKLQLALDRLGKHKPKDGTLEVHSPAEVLARRMRELEGCRHAN